MTVTLYHNNFTIELFDDRAFVQDGDSPTSYHKIIQVDKDKPYGPNAQHAIKIFNDSILINSAIVLASGGGTGVDSDSALIDDGNLIMRCCNKIFSLTIPDLQTNWVTEADWATCFSFHPYQESYISHGETSIARIDKSGKILWSYSGADIFVCLEEGIPFEMFDTYIALTDFNGSTYKIDYDGKTLDYNESDYHKRQAITVVMKSQKKWWKFW